MLLEEGVTKFWRCNSQHAAKSALRLYRNNNFYAIVLLAKITLIIPVNRINFFVIIFSLYIMRNIDHNVVQGRYLKNLLR